MPAEIGRYRVLRRLGSGAFATVWLAEDDVLDSPVAIKVLADNWAHHPDVRARFEQEAQLLRLADSERLVRVHDFGELPDGRPYQVMTYADGGTLAERLADGPMPVRAALRTAADIAEAVSVLHQAGVLHRDLKPSNVLFSTVRGSRRVLVADLGLAKTIAHASGFTVVAGTPGYMAPEQSVPGGGIDVRTDVHALGALTYHMLTGRPPGSREGRTGMPPAPPSKVRPGIPRQVDHIVLQALERDRQRRWPTADRYATALRAAAVSRPGRSRLHRALSRTAGSVAVLAMLVALGGSSEAAGWTRVADSSGTLSLAVPRDWAEQVRSTGWDPATVGLPSGRRPGLLVGADLGSWGDPLHARPGVFAGESPALADGDSTLRPPTHGGCRRQPDRPVTVAGSTARMRRWTSCGGTAVSYSEVVLDGVYVQIKQAGGTDRTDEVLRTLRRS
ncbi:serine/threonine-protein kinase [Jidongwangia harbinensis]|uniref:serine/threonine-protein kinase n=1 Tax=Jidongwangia harbinensis TaxID=2878561 RepID=UPI001CDA219D|nr:serine/threonine-protein kinase [Jidongwangia harbinensis]MCA2213377.1 serine/threonine protein kinase [Jidongwangia harbinensis]